MIQKDNEVKRPRRVNTRDIRPRKARVSTDYLFIYLFIQIKVERKSEREDISISKTERGGEVRGARHSSKRRRSGMMSGMK